MVRQAMSDRELGRLDVLRALHEGRRQFAGLLLGRSLS
jgi:hypothetical protein